MGIISQTHTMLQDKTPIPETYQKGEQFERWVRENLFPKTHYYLLQKTPNYLANKDDFADNSKEPDFKFRSLANDKEFYIEAKYRSGYLKGALNWCKYYQLRRYHSIDKKYL